jgi:hypothetical protein
LACSFGGEKTLLPVPEIESQIFAPVAYLLYRLLYPDPAKPDGTYTYHSAINNEILMHITEQAAAKLAMAVNIGSLPRGGFI